MISLSRNSTLESLLRKSPTLQPRLERLMTGTATNADLLWAQPWKLLETESSKPDKWQIQVLRKQEKTNWIVCGSRGSGKSSVAAAAVFRESVLCGNFAAVISATEMQVTEFHRNFINIWNRWNGRLGINGDVQKTQAEFSNGGRVVTRPASEVSVRGLHGVKLLVLSEASRIPDVLASAIDPVLVISKGRRIAESTPYGKRGWFWETWNKTVNEKQRTGWTPALIPWRVCPRISHRDYQNYADQFGEMMARQEFDCEFLDMAAGSPFDMGRWESMLGDGELL